MLTALPEEDKLPVSMPSENLVLNPDKKSDLPSCNILNSENKLSLLPGLPTIPQFIFSGVMGEYYPKKVASPILYFPK